MDLSKLLAFNQLVLDKPEDEKKKLAADFGIDYEEFKERMVGKEKEADFIVILKSLGVLKHFEAFDEGLSHITGEYTPDFNVELRDGYKMMIEVKHTHKGRYEISKGNLQKRIDFADRFGMPLRFAVSLKGFWGLFTGEDLLKKNGKLEIDDFGGKKSISWLDRELDTCSYMFEKQVKIKSVYSKKHPKGMGIRFEPYGNLVSYELYYDDRKVFRFKGEGCSFKAYSVYLEALQDRIANTNQHIVENGDITVITEFTDEGQMQCIPEYEFLLAPIRHMRKRIDGKRIVYDTQLAISEKNFTFLDVRVLRCFMSKLVDLGMDIIVFKGNKGFHFRDYANQFWGGTRMGRTAY